MVELALVLCNFLMVGSVLAYFYFKERKFQDFYEEISGSKDDLIESISMNKDSLTNEIIHTFLEHSKPEPVQEAAAVKISQEMVNEILQRTPPIVENDIEKDAEQIDKENFMDVFAQIPLDENTKVAFENELPKEEIVD